MYCIKRKAASPVYGMPPVGFIFVPIVHILQLVITTSTTKVDLQMYFHLNRFTLFFIDDPISKQLHICKVSTYILNYI